MQLPSLKERLALHDAATVAAARKKELLAKNKEAARALLSALQSPTVSSVSEIVQKNYDQ